MINLEIDGKTVAVENGSTVMEAANKVGSFIPHFCYHKKLSIAANCRTAAVVGRRIRDRLIQKRLAIAVRTRTHGCLLYTSPSPRD